MKSKESWPTLAEEALHGLPGDVVRAVDPHTEADPVAVLASLLAAFGGACGRGAHVRVGADAHYLNIFAALVGETSKGRKGTSWGCVRDLMRNADGAWADERIVNGLSSGEGLIHAVRDATEYRDRKGEVRVDDEGVQDKRLLVLAPELAAALKVASRQGNIVTAVIRQAFDGEKLQTLTRNNPQKATGAHVSMIGHITRSELLRYLTETEAANGFANRFLWIMVRRSKQLPFGGRWSEVDTAALVGRLKTALEFGSSHKEISWGEDAGKLWVRVYGPLSEGGQGMFGAVTGRAEAQVVRLAALYAAMDRSREIGAGHLKAALALWDYAEDSARYIFGDATGDPVADRIYGALKAAPEGMTRTQISNLFKRHKDAAEIDRALQTLLTGGRATRETKPRAEGRRRGGSRRENLLSLLSLSSRPHHLKRGGGPWVGTWTSRRAPRRQRATKPRATKGRAASPLRKTRMPAPEALRTTIARCSSPRTHADATAAFWRTAGNPAK